MKHRYPSTKKQEILKLYYDGASPMALIKTYNIPESTLFYWITKYPEGIVKKKSLSRFSSWSKTLSHTNKIEAELEFLKRTVVNKIPKRERIKIIDEEYGKESLHVQCEALEVDRGTYLNHKNRNKNEDAWFYERRAKFTEKISEIFEDSGHLYGAEKIQNILKKQGEKVSIEFVRDIMRENGLVSILSPRSKEYRSNKKAAKADYNSYHHSSQDYNVTDINQVWVADVTLVAVHGRYYYISVILDLFSRKVVGYAIGRNNSTHLTKMTFIQAYADRKQPKNLILHTDNGMSYTSYSFEKMLAERKVAHSYSRIGYPRDNAVIESFFSSLKHGGVYLNGYPKSFRELKIAVEEYMTKYNSKIPHEHLNYDAPDEFEKKATDERATTQQAQNKAKSNQQ